MEHGGPPAKTSPAAPTANPPRFALPTTANSNGAPPRPSLTQAKKQDEDRKARLLRLNELYAQLDREGKLADYAHGLEQSLSGDQTDRDSLEELCILFQSPMLRNPGKEFQYLKSFVEYDKTNPTALLRLSQYEAKNRNTETAFELASEAARIHPERASAHRLDGAIFLNNSGDNARSAQLCEQIIQDPAAGARGLLYAGDQLAQLGRTDLALQAYNQAAERADQDNLRQRAQVGAYGIRVRTEGVDAVRTELEALAKTGVTPLIQRQAQGILTNHPTTSPQ